MKDKVILREKDFREQVVDLAKLLGYKTYFTWTSIHSPRGMPDLILCKPPHLIFAELKTDKKTSQLSEHQQAWIDLLSKCPQVEVYIWRPSNLDEIVEILNNAEHQP